MECSRVHLKSELYLLRKTISLFLISRDLVLNNISIPALHLAHFFKDFRISGNSPHFKHTSQRILNLSGIFHPNPHGTCVMLIHFNIDINAVYITILQLPVALSRSGFLVYIFRLLAALVLVHSLSLYCKSTLYFSDYFVTFMCTTMWVLQGM
jgi:hypothetical protein